KAAGASELRHANKELTRRIKVLEERLSDREQVREAAAAPMPASSPGSPPGVLPPLRRKADGAPSPLTAPSEGGRWPHLDHDDGEEILSGFAGATPSGSSRASP